MKRLRIVQQIIIVSLFAVIVPFITIGLIITNVSQQYVRRELNYGVKQISMYIADAIERYILGSDKEFDYITFALKNIPTNSSRQKFLKDTTKVSDKFSNLEIINASRQGENYQFNPKTRTVKLYTPINDKEVLTGDLNIDGLDNLVADKTTNFTQSIFIFDEQMHLVVSNDYGTEAIKEVTETLPANKQEGVGVIFSKRKNQPFAYYKLSNPDWTVVVMTQPSVTKNTITKAKVKIVLSLLIAAICILLAVSVYVYYLYVNIRQLFKGIIAISKGSYDRKIRLLKSIFTPHEIVFLEKEFNYMTQKVSQAYSEIRQRNLELKRLNEYRDSLVSAVSHEFRTPLTSIIGYSSRLMRQDISISEEMKQKSLHIIKDQAQRLSRMVDDLLTVPDIESSHLAFKSEPVDLSKIVELCAEYSKKDNVEFGFEVDEHIPLINSDYDKLIQIILNLFSNALKYNLDDEIISISLKNYDRMIEFKISNKSENISPEFLDKLYDKFIRLDTELTRTTRGTGLGLYIVKGLCDAMGIIVFVSCVDNKFTATLRFNKNNE